MKARHKRVLPDLLLVIATALFAGPVGPAAPEAAAQAAAGLGKCQSSVAKEGGAYVRGIVDSVGRCLGAATESALAGRGVDDSAASACIKSLIKVRNAELPEKTLAARFDARVGKACDPDLNPGLTFSESDIYTIGSTTLGASNLEAYCEAFHGGPINEFDAWRECVRKAADCQAWQAIATQWPRALELTADLLASSQVAANFDALTALTDLDTALEGATDDDVPEVVCGLVEGTCGDGVVNAVGEQCDGEDLGGETCESLNFFGGNLLCYDCKLDTFGCTRAGGTASVEDVVEGATFSNLSAANLVGTMPRNGSIVLTPGTENQPIPAGHHTGDGYCAGDPNLTAGNIRSGASIFGISGSLLDASGNAQPSHVLSGQTFSNSGGSATGTMPNRGSVQIAPGFSNQQIPAGYHNGTGFCAGDGDLFASNIRSGVNIFGVEGTAVEATGDAQPSVVLSGHAFSNADGPGIGTMPNHGAVTITPGTTVQPIAAGYHNGSGSCAGDSRLIEANIVNGSEIFGIAGVAQTGPLQTGQTTSQFGAGSDGVLQKGAGRRFTDNGDGTITDHTTGLMWEKKSDDGSVHDRDNIYAWQASTGMDGDMVTVFLAGLNSGSGFAGHTDWRIPNINELLTLVNWEMNLHSGAVFAPFNTSCSPGCTSQTCDCVSTSNGYWTSTAAFPDTVAYTLSFAANKFYRHVIRYDGQHVRAVRGGAKGCTRCAAEGDACHFTGTRRVRFGADGKYFSRTVTGGTACTVEAFDGDPIFGVVKHCDYCEL